MITKQKYRMYKPKMVFLSIALFWRIANEIFLPTQFFRM